MQFEQIHEETVLKKMKFGNAGTGKHEESEWKLYTGICWKDKNGISGNILRTELCLISLFPTYFYVFNCW